MQRVGWKWDILIIHTKMSWDSLMILVQKDPLSVTSKVYVLHMINMIDN